MQKKDNRGGARPGAGRKPSGHGETVAFRVSAETKARLEELKARGVDVRGLFENFVKNFALTQK